MFLPIRALYLNLSLAALAGAAALYPSQVRAGEPVGAGIPPGANVRFVSDRGLPESNSPASHLVQYPPENRAAEVPEVGRSASAPFSADGIPRPQTARDHLQKGLGLMRENPQAAEDEFLQALADVSRRRDTQGGSHSYSQSLANGILALWEFDEYVRVLQSEGTQAARSRAAAFSTDVARAVESESLQPSRAVATYLAFARQSLVVALGAEPTASHALYGMARVTQRRSRSQGDTDTEQAKALALLQTAVTVDRNNWRAANEIGIIYARKGYLQRAEQALRHSIQVHPHAENWHNLAHVYKQQGNTALAAEAATHAQALRRDASRRPPPAGDIGGRTQQGAVARNDAPRVIRDPDPNPANTRSPRATRKFLGRLFRSADAPVPTQPSATRPKQSVQR